MKQTDKTEWRNSSTIVVRGFSFLIEIKNRINIQKISKKIEAISNIIGQLDLTDLIQNTLLNHTEVHIFLQYICDILKLL